MASPAIIWRNPIVVQRRRIWNQARKSATSSLVVVVRAVSERSGEWEGLPNLEILEGGAASQGRKRTGRTNQTKA
jgi:hypothetical protein